MPNRDKDVFERAREFEAQNPGVADAMRLFDASFQRYEASLTALYTPRIVTSGSTEDLSARVE